MCPHCDAEVIVLTLGFGESCHREWQECPECGWVGETTTFGCGGYSAEEHQSCAAAVPDNYYCTIPASFCSRRGDDPCSCPEEGPLCGRCYDEGPLEPAPCAEHPEQHGHLGMYHCPECGAMLFGGLPHFPLCHRCATRTHPQFDDC